MGEEKMIHVNTYYCEEAKGEILQLWQFEDDQKTGREVVLGSVDETDPEILEVDLLPIEEGEEFDRVSELT